MEGKVGKFTNFGALNQQQDTFESNVITNKGVLSPIQRLLPELLQEIFIHCLPTTRNPSMSASEAPIFFGRVCGHWRTIAYSTPALWSAIHIMVRPDTRASSNIQARRHVARPEAVVSWLLRSGARPLSLSISVPYVNWYPTGGRLVTEALELYMDGISPFLPRSKSLDISVLNGEPWQWLILKYFTAEFPLLSHLSLNTTSSNWDDEAIRDGLKECSLIRSPELRTLALAGYGPRAMNLPLAWQQLAALRLGKKRDLWEPRRAFLDSDALLLLSWCPNLTECVLPLSSAATPANVGRCEQIHPLVILPNLISFAILCDKDPKHFFGNISAPSLRNFIYQQEEPLSPEEIMDGKNAALHLSLGPFLRRITRPVEEFQITASHLTADDLISCLELFPELKRLGLVCVGGKYPSAWAPPERISVSRKILERFMLGDGLTDTLIHTQKSSEMMIHGPWSGGNRNLNGRKAKDRSGQASDIKCLCPKLGVLEIKGASFSDELLLKFIRFRFLSDATRFGVSPLRWFGVTFSPDRVPAFGVLGEIETLKKQAVDAFIGVRYIPRFKPRSYETDLPCTALAWSN